MSTRIARALVVWAAGCLLAGPALAGGLYIQEWATPSQSLANAGAGAVGDTAATAFHNPASMTRLDDHQALAGAGLLMADIEFDQSQSTPVAGSDGSQQGGPGPILSSHYVHRLYDRDDAEWLNRFRFGVSLVSISGAVLDPDNDWAGRYEVQELSLFTISAFPSVAIRLHDTFSVGVGAALMYGRMDYKLAVPLPDGGEGRVKFDWIDGFDAAPTVSALWEPNDTTRIGVLWQDEIELDLDGDVKLDPIDVSLNTKTKIPFAQFVHVSGVHEFSDDFWFAVTFRWEDWSTFGNQFLAVSGNQRPLPRNWKDTWGGSAGFRYRLDETWSVSSGFGYDSSPVKAKHRTADMPMDRQWRLAAGAQMTRGTTMYGVNFSYANLGKGKIRSDNLRGSYDTNQLFALTFFMSFGSLPWGADPEGV